MENNKMIVWILAALTVLSVIGLSLISVLSPKPCDEIDCTLLSVFLITITIMSVLALALIMYKSLSIDQEDSRHKHKMEELMLRYLTEKVDLKKELNDDNEISLKMLLENFNKFLVGKG